MSLAQVFLEIGVARAKAAARGLPPGSAILQHACHACNRIGEHASVERTNERGAAWERITCLACGHFVEVSVR